MLLDIGVESCMVEITVCFLRVTITYVNKYNTINTICMYVCMYVRIYGCKNGWMDACMRACKNGWMDG